ncbi:MAG: hypothetical protein LBQ60_00720 [Bacteroidales bacterium]|nr:hypothetical protein [Bacteroidales bacterium]
MKRAQLVKLWIWGTISLMIGLTCSCDEFCEESNRTAMVVNFYIADTDSVLEVEKLTVQGLDTDSVLYREVTAKTVLCPLNPGADLTKYIFTNDTITDTIIISYTRHTGFVSSECGCVNYSSIEIDPNTIFNSIKKIEITNPTVGPVSYRPDVINEENIRIYY